MEIEKFASAAAIGGFIVTSIGFLYGMWKDQRLRERERRVRLEENEIRRIEVTERFLNGIWNKSLTRHALYMIDYPEKEYLSETGERYLINKNDIKSALTFLKNKDLDDQKKYFIRECFDSLGNDLDFLNNLYARGLVNTQIIDSYLIYYFKKISHFLPEAKMYFKEFGNGQVLEFMENMLTSKSLSSNRFSSDTKQRQINKNEN